MIDLSEISLQFGGKYLFENVSFKINSGDKISLVGANGTGKSSLLKIISGTLLPEEGKVLKQKRISIGYLPQENVTHKGKTLIEEAKSALSDILSLQQKEKKITDELNNQNISEEQREDLVHQLGEVHHRLEELGSYSAEANVKKILIGLGFEEDDFEKLTDTFSGGWQMRIALAKILISQNDLLLMDEPTNHLDLDSLDWLINYLKAFEGALLIVSHDKRFINEVTNRTLEIFMNRFYTYRGNYDAYLKFKVERDEQIENLFVQQQKKIKETEKFIERFRYKATKAKQVQSRIKQLEKIELLELPENKSDINIRLPVPPTSGKVNITLKSISKSYGDKNVFKGLDFKVDRGEKIAFVGPNGAGKTTLSKIIAGVIDFDSGERIIGHNTFISFYAQDVADNLDPDLDILETVDQIAENKTLGELRGLLGSFLFSGDDVFKKVGVLSGGEKSRVALAKILLTKANFIILDEPTNHLDISSKEVLQKALIEFNGSLILVSHDIDFLKPVVNKVVEIKKNSLKEFPDGIEYYLNKKEEAQKIQSQESLIDKEKIDSSSRKEQKRIEAEKRQQRYKATKDFKERLAGVEKEIQKLERELENINAMLLNPDTYNDHTQIRELNEKHRVIKLSLDEKVNEWEEISLNLEGIEKEFD